jgi:anti-sigma-K factor RskA
MAHEEYKEMLPALALSALDAEDALSLNQHLADCAECRRELADWESTAAALALSASPAEPAPAVRERIMSAVRAEKQSAQQQASQQQSAQQASRVVPFPQSRRAVWTSFGQVGAIAAAVLFLVLIIWIIVLWQQNRALRRDVEALSRQTESMYGELSRSNEFLTILSGPGAKVAQLQGSGEASGAIAQIAYDGYGRAMLLANGLPPTPSGKEYQLWFIVGKNAPIPGKTFVTDGVGRGELTDHIPQGALNAAVFAVTLEPAGGSTTPTSPIYLRSSL